MPSPLPSPMGSSGGNELFWFLVASITPFWCVFMESYPTGRHMITSHLLDNSFDSLIYLLSRLLALLLLFWLVSAVDYRPDTPFNIPRHHTATIWTVRFLMVIQIAQLETLPLLNDFPSLSQLMRNNQNQKLPLLTIIAYICFSSE